MAAELPRQRPDVERAIAAFQVEHFARHVGARKESNSPYAYEWLFTCPYCSSSRLRFNTQKRTGICWGCKKGFDVFKLVRDVLKLNEMETVEWFVSRYVGGDSTAGSLGSALAPMLAAKPAVRRLPQAQWPDGAELLTSPCLPHARAWQYLQHRGITEEMVREFGLAFGRSGRVKDRLIFPCRMDGTLVYWQARATWDPPPGLSGDQRRAWVEAAEYVKSINPLIRAADDVQGHEVLFNYERASVEPHVVICEGPIDAIKVGLHAVALLGKTAGPVKIERLKRMRAQRFTIYLDRGTEERASTNAIARELTSFAACFTVEPPDGYDAGALTREYNAALISGYAKPWIAGLL